MIELYFYMLAGAAELLQRVTRSVLVLEVTSFKYP